jgi:steroid delta-isomerase-like uncharacterized protein
MANEENKAVVQRFWDEWNNKNLEAMADLVAEDGADHALPPGVPANKEGSFKLIAMYMQAFPDLHIKVEDLIAEGDKVVCRITSSGTNTGPLMGMPATGKSATMTAIHIFRVRNGKLQERWANQDDLGMMQQLGVIPAPAQ